jgi:hypothetical protein
MNEQLKFDFQAYRPLFKILSVCKGGGYMYCRTIPPHPRRNSKGLYPLHRVLMENKLGRALLPGEDVHHDDEDKRNNNPDNLLVKTKSEHTAEHRRRTAPAPETAVCPCGKHFTMTPGEFRLRIKRAKSLRLYCSLRCAGKFATENIQPDVSVLGTVSI